jgi:hypothetical protein
MDEKSDQILGHIEAQRNQLGANLNELETRVRRTTDWRTHFDRNPMLMLAGALGGGLLLGTMLGGSKSRSGSSSYTSSRHFSGSSGSVRNTNSATYVQKQRASETLDNVKAALIAFATSRAKEFLNEALPGFDNYMRDAESNKSRSQFSSAGEPGSTGSEQNTGYGQQQPPSGYGSQTSGSGQGANYGQNYGSDYGRYGTGQRNPSTEQQYSGSGSGTPPYGNS